ncbi:NADH:flavin oxidoreductase/NADH oxidase [Pinirhizobacter sp.]|jgi:2,4-dienoyl-CoA reductase-like NADH-dependent reductase (Old Yellow Enzyme family)|uniref:NADH:flavin oxidoreductase/NADH oxidase n=1 Tax=Pinirhizobacter sp. TaxID=2950432 RepID=UPI002F416BE5
MSLFEPLQQRGLQLRNRIVMSPMCEYSATDGLPNHWHLVHLGSRAVGGAGLVVSEATAVLPEGRISHGDTGIWNDAQIAAWQPITAFIRSQGAHAGVQLAHAGRKASAQLPWQGGGPLGRDESPWPTVAPSALPFDEGWHVPAELDEAGIQAVIEAFRIAAGRAAAAGFELVEIHAAHGYLLHQFLSPLSNHRTDQWGGDLEGRTRLLREVVRAVRQVWPETLPVWVRISATDWIDGGWDDTMSVQLSRMLKELGVDLIDVSSGGNVAGAKIPVGPGYQVHFASRIRHEAGMATGAVGMIIDSAQADKVISDGSADVVLLARELLRDPYFPRRAASELGVKIQAPLQYGRAW